MKWSAPIAMLKRLLARRPRESPLAVAQAACRAEAWPWTEPTRVEDDVLHWVVVTASDPSGRGARIVIKKSTGRIVCKSFIRRRTPKPPR